ncbi:hypothetical protein [Paenibacillus sonchi]|uniref:hypothetical protein n=1 Tax=Paenibacillus sonchi TaxID=373687 RepID=UPI0002E9CC32|nr:hypothetical protein [Paenibacillus sonchi]MCE3199055.1 hypothetical protein [Paenibacillus sonchi]
MTAAGIRGTTFLFWIAAVEGIICIPEIFHPRKKVIFKKYKWTVGSSLAKEDLEAVAATLITP